MTATIAKLRSTVAFQMALDRQRLATQVVAHRDRQHFTQRDLEAKSGVSLRTIQRVENPGDVEEVRYSTIERLAKGLGVKPEDLTGDAIEHVPPGEIGSGDTPDVMGSLNGDTPQLDRIEEKLDRVLAILEADDSGLAEVNRAVAAIEAMIDTDEAGEAATGS